MSTSNSISPSWINEVHAAILALSLIWFHDCLIISIPEDFFKFNEFSTANLFIPLLINLNKVSTGARLRQYGCKNCTLVSRYPKNSTVLDYQ